MECEKRAEKLRLIKGLRELGESVGDVNCGGFGVREEFGKAEKADRAALLCWENEDGAVALTASIRHRLRRWSCGGAVHTFFDGYFQMEGGKGTVFFNNQYFFLIFFIDVEFILILLLVHPQ